MAAMRFLFVSLILVGSMLVGASMPAQAVSISVSSSQNGDYEDVTRTENYTPSSGYRSNSICHIFPSDPATCFQAGGGFVPNDPDQFTTPFRYLTIGMENGTHTIRYTAREEVSDGNGGTVTNTAENSLSLSIDNTPTITVSAPSGLLQGYPGDIVGQASFQGAGVADTEYGTVTVRVYDSSDTLLTSLVADATGETTIDLSTLGTLPTLGWPNDDYRLEATATARNGSTDTASTTFSIDHTPTINLTGPSGHVQTDYLVQLQGSVSFIDAPVAGSWGKAFIKVYRSHGSLHASYNLDANQGPTLDLSSVNIPSQTFDTYTVEVTARAANLAMAGPVTVSYFTETYGAGPLNEAANGGKDGKCGTDARPSGGTDSDNPSGSGQCSASSAGKTGNPIQIANGNKMHSETDFVIGASDMPLRMVRHYHSRSTTYSNRIGLGWTWTYGWKLRILNQAFGTQIGIRRADGKQMLFVRDTDETFHRILERYDETIVPLAGGGWRYTHHNNSYVDFNAAGDATAIHHEDGRAYTIDYDAAGYPATVTGPYGRQLHITTNNYGRIESITGPLGRTWQYVYSGDRLWKVIYPDGSMRKYVYTSNKLAGIYDESGMRLSTYVYSGYRVISSQRTSGQRHDVVYNADGTITVTEADGTVRDYVTTVVNGIPDVTEASSPGCAACGGTVAFSYNSENLLESSTDANGVVTTYAYSADGRLTEEIEAAGTPFERHRTFTYTASGHLLSATDAAGNVAAYTYDASGHRTSETDPLGNTRSWSWNADGTLASETDADSGVTTYAYDAFGQVTSITGPDGATRTMAYDAAGRLIASADALGATTTYAYDARDRLLTTTGPDGATVTNAYDIVGNLISTTDAAGLVTTYQYDIEKRPILVTRPDGTSVRSTYDAKGNLVLREVLDAASAVVSSEAMTYDPDGRLLTTTHADGSVTSNAYDLVGNLTTTTDEAGRTTTNIYNLLGRLTSTSNPAGETVSYSYDVLDRRTGVTDAGGVSTTFSFDANGNLLAEVSPDRGTTSYAYGPAGVLLAKTDGNGAVTNYAYDATHRLTAISYPSDPTLNTGFTYDAGGRITAMTDAGGATAYAYDVAGRTTAVNWVPAGTALALNLAYTYDAAGRVASVTYPSGHAVSYTYSSTDGRITDVTGTWLHPNGTIRTEALVSGIQYDTLGDVASRTLGNGIVETRSYDNRGRLTAITAAGVLERALTWSPESTITAIADNVNPAVSQTFAYDPADRLTNATGSYGNLAFTYDANGNRMTRTHPGGVESYVYTPGTNRLTAAQWPAGATKSFEYDAAGNQTRRGSLDFTYGAHNRATAVHKRSDGALKGEYLYNGKGERVKRTVYPDLNPPTTFYYVYDLSGQLIGEYDGTGELKGEYVYGPTGRLATLKKWYGNTRWHDSDHLGTPQAMTNKDGIVIWQADYTPFGIATINRDPDGDGNQVWNRFRFPGQYWDWETQTHYNYFRQYDPRTGRYTQHDPIGLDGGMNPYGYVGGNPVIRVDLTGKKSYLAGRPLDKIDYAGHMYVVTHADYLGDSCNIHIFSFGKTNEGFVGRVTNKTKGDSRGTSAVDEKHWLSLLGKKSSFAVQLIPASDDIVASFGNRLKEHHPYKRLGPNSNSAAKAVANRSSGMLIMSPMGWYPGEEDWPIMEFRK